VPLHPSINIHQQDKILALVDIYLPDRVKIRSRLYLWVQAGAPSGEFEIDPYTARYSIVNQSANIQIKAVLLFSEYKDSPCHSPIWPDCPEYIRQFETYLPHSE